MTTYLRTAPCGCLIGVVINGDYLTVTADARRRGEHIEGIAPGTVEQRILDSTLISECPHGEERGR
jgi:hypothetical protein